MRNYVFHGIEDKAFNSLGSDLIETARELRDGYLNESRREIEIENIEFKAIQTCPQCRLVDIPYFRVREDGTLGGRECRQCGYVWHTV